MNDVADVVTVLVARAAALHRSGDRVPQPVRPLRHGYACVVVTDELRRRVAEQLAAPGQGEEEQPELVASRTLAEAGLELDDDVAFALLHAGPSSQSATVLGWSLLHRSVVDGPAHAPADPRDLPVNTALRRIGVVADPGADEPTTLGLDLPRPAR